MLNKLLFVFWRLTVVVIAFIVAVMVFLLRLFDIQINKTSFLQQQSDFSSLRQIDMPASRGNILDRNGVYLAINTKVADIWVNPKQLYGNENNIRKLARVLHINEEALLTKVSNNRNRDFIYVARDAQPFVANQILSLKMPYVYINNGSKRFYPYFTTSQTIGITNLDNKGIEGLELIFDEYLQATNGVKTVRRVNKKIVNNLFIEKQSKNGKDIQSSLDVMYQHIVYKELSKAVVTHKAKSASAIMLNAKTGEILALANYPVYNPNNVQDINSIRNLVITDYFEPGSTIKPFIIAAAIDSGRWSQTSTVDVHQGEMQLGKFTIKDVAKSTRLDLNGILLKSSNIGISKVALDIGKERVYGILDKIGVGKKILADFPSSTKGFLLPLAKWKQVETASNAYGYGLGVSLLQLANFYAILANDGKMIEPTILKNFVRPFEAQVIKPYINNQIVEMLKNVVSSPSGGGYRAHIPNLKIAGKSGTVRKQKNGAYTEDYRSIFAGFVEFKDAKIVLAIMVDEPKNGEYYGGAVAAPIFREIITKISMLNPHLTSQKQLLLVKNEIFR